VVRHPFEDVKPPETPHLWCGGVPSLSKIVRKIRNLG